jgi:hypothetical protein
MAVEKTTPDTVSPDQDITLADDESGSLVVESLAATTALAALGVEVARKSLEHVLNVADVVVTGSLDLTQDWLRGPGILPQVVIGPIDVARRGWSASAAGGRDVLARI